MENLNKQELLAKLDEYEKKIPKRDLAWAVKSGMDIAVSDIKRIIENLGVVDEQ
ncbi:MAG: hypothetical protein KBT03_04615 [Bacteroidales bacterium]|nr:hypothetical protein [Candidatus Scybalousia scybalohippi]